MPPLNILIKPVSSACNLRCRYCIYTDAAENRAHKNYGIMTVDTLEVIVRKALEYGDSYVSFIFQGGEPTLAGLDFYRRLLVLEAKYNRKRLPIRNVIQTNGMLIDEAWARFFAENHFLVGISLDGPKEIHDLYRIDSEGNGSFDRVMKTVNLCNRYHVEYNILTVINKIVARHIEQVYNFFVEQGFNYLQFIPCLDGLGEEPGQNPYSLTPQVYGDCLKRLFNVWYRDFQNGKQISIRMFDNILQILSGMGPKSCDMNGCCSANIIIEADGSVFPCDFYVVEQWKTGNILSHEIWELLRGERAQAFSAVSQAIVLQCGRCEYYGICRGGCRRHYEPMKDSVTGENYFCSAYRDFYQATLSKFCEMAQCIRIGA